MHHFRFKNGELFCENMSVQETATAVETPFYLYSRNTITDNYTRVDSAFAGLDHLICFAVKANSNVALLSLLAQKGAGADVVSGGELYLALKSGFEPGKIVFAGVGKRDDEIRYGLKEKILAFNVESIAELKVINKIAESLGKSARIGLRLNPDINIEGHPYISTGKSVDKFGIDWEAARGILRDFRNFAHVELAGLHCHLGSQISMVEPYVKAVRFLKEAVREVARQRLSIEYVDIGGGLAIRDRSVFVNDSEDNGDKERPISIAELVGAIAGDLADLGCKVLFEPGRFLLAESGILVTKVLFRKESRGKQFVVVDAGMSDLIRPSLYGAYHEIVPVRRKGDETTAVDVVGPICESGDFFARDRLLPVVDRDDLLAIMTAGAYGFSLSSNYNARPRPAEILVSGTTHKTIRPRGRVEELWSS